MGDYVDSDGVDHGFLLSSGVFTTIDVDVPGATDSPASAINDRGEIVGSYLDSGGIYHGYLLSNGVFTTIDFPGANHTLLYGNNNKGEIVGRYVTDPNVNRSPAQHAFLLSFGRFVTVDPPGWTGRAIASEINNRSQIAGLFRDAAGRHGFLATPVAP